MRPYWYGTYYLPCTKQLLDKKRAQYPEHYGEDRTERYLRDIADGQICGDCVNGAIKGAVWSELGSRAPVYCSHDCPDTNADGMFYRCKGWGMDWGGISSLPDEPGIAVRMSGHVGIYVGKGEVVEWRGFACGCVLTKLSERRWVHWYRLPWVEYVTAASNETEQMPLGARLLRRGCIGEDVRTLQSELLEMGYPLARYGADGEYGAETESAVRAFQQTAQIDADGIYGEETHGALLRLIAERDAQPDDGVPALPEKYVRVTGESVNLRMGAGVEYDAVGIVRRDMRFEWVATAHNGWHAVRAGGLCGWLSPRFSEVVAA